METKEKQTLRSTCWNFNSIIDEKLGMDVILDGKHLGDLELYYPPPASHIVIRDFPAEINLSQILVHSSDVKWLTLDGNMSPNVLKMILKKCQRIEKLDVTTMFKCSGLQLQIDDSSPDDTLPTLHRLKQLHFPNVFKPTGFKFYPDMEWTNIKDILTKLEMPHVEIFELKFFFNCQTDFLNSVDTLYEFLEQHLTLKHLELILRQGKACTHGHDSLNSPHFHVKVREMTLFICKQYL